MNAYSPLKPGIRISAPWLKSTPWAVFTWLLAAISASGQQTNPPATLPELQQRLAEHLSQPKFAAAIWGVKIVSLDSGQTTFEHNQQKLFSPASNSKLYTVALALDQLGADYRIKTSLYAKEKPNKRGVLKGDLMIYGRGDPTINARLHGDDIYNAIEPLVIALTNAGVKRIAGDLIADESYFHGPPFGSGWAWDDMEYYYGAEISALTINDNTLQVLVKPGERVGLPCKLTLSPATAYVTFSNRTETVEKDGKPTISFYRPLEENVIYATGRMPLEAADHKDQITIHKPPALILVFFKQALARHGIKVNGKLRTMNWLQRQDKPVQCDKMVELGALESLPLREIAREVMKPSQNLYTDLLLAHVGEKTRSSDTSPERTSEELGIHELRQFLQKAGIPAGEVLFEEGSGLSRNNLTTPNATSALLQFMNRHPCAGAYLEALPIAGVDGTLKNRMKGTAAAGNVRAKTGTLRWANSLSGHVTTAAGEHLIFSIMLNRYHNTDPKQSGRAEIDAIAVMLASFTGRAETAGR